VKFSASGGGNYPFNLTALEALPDKIHFFTMKRGTPGQIL
jgi:hypothetical protein